MEIPSVRFAGSLVLHAVGVLDQRRDTSATLYQTHTGHVGYKHTVTTELAIIADCLISDISVKQKHNLGPFGFTIGVQLHVSISISISISISRSFYLPEE